MADVAQLVRASGCGSEGRGFNSHHSPQTKYEGILPSYLVWDVLLNRTHGGFSKKIHGKWVHEASSSKNVFTYFYKQAEIGSFAGQRSDRLTIIRHFYYWI